MANLLHQTISRNRRHSRAGFTLIEVLVALGVMGVAISIFFNLYLASNKMAQTSKSNDVAVRIAEEYMNELRIHPELFNWPDYANPPLPDGSYEIELKDNGHESIFLVSPSNAIAPSERAFNRDNNLYGNFGWFAFARLNEDSDNYVEIMVRVRWLDGDGNNNLCISSLLPRSIGEGAGR